MRLALTGLCFVGCVVSKTTTTEKIQPKGEAVVEDKWIDPLEDYPTSRARLRPGKMDALVNAKAKPLVIKGGVIMTAAGRIHRGGYVILDGGRIVDVGAGEPPLIKGAQVIDAAGRFVTPGIIDAHSHIGVYATPHVDSHSDGNEMTGPATGDAQALYGYWPGDPAISRALAGGVTAALILPGSANLVGGRGFAVVMKPGVHSREVAFPGAPATVKMACGENPKRVYAEKGGPATRMGEYAAFRSLLHGASDYAAKWKRYTRDRQAWLWKKRVAEKADKKSRPKAEAAPERPSRDLKLETLASVLSGDVLVQVHCYRAAEMREMIEIADEFAFSIRAFHHALEAYKIRDVLAERDIAVATWADWWGFKMEAFDGIPENAALVAEAGGRTIIHSDSSNEIQRLNQEAGKAYAAGRRAGIKLSEDAALRWITANPAWAIGIDDVTGTLEKGKRADVVLWSGHPFSVYSKADTVIQAGTVVYERSKGLRPSDFELDNSGIVEGEPTR